MQSRLPLKTNPSFGQKQIQHGVVKVVAGVIGYPAEKLQPAAMEPQPMASLPSISVSSILISVFDMKFYQMYWNRIHPN